MNARRTPRGYKGLPMEGMVATWYARNTARDRGRFDAAAALVAERARPGARVLEVAPGPGYLAIELARRGYAVSALDISKSFVRMVQDHAAAAGVNVDVRHGDAAHMPFADGSFDYVICMAAFKNFTDPVGAINEMHRVLASDGVASILDLRKDATRPEIADEVRNMHLSPVNARVTEWTFRFMLLKLAYSRSRLEQMARESRFACGEVLSRGIGCELRLATFR